MAASTTWGLFLLVLMLGYGLVQVPTTIYDHSRTAYMLSHVQFKLSQLYNEKIDIEEKLESLVEEVAKLCPQIKYNDPLRPCIEQIVQIIPEQYANRVKLTMDDYEDYRATSSSPHLTDLPSEKQLIRLHQLLKKSKHVHHRIQASWLQMIDQAFFLEEILHNEQNSNHLFVKQSPLPHSWLRRTLFDQHSKLGNLDELHGSSESGERRCFRMVHFLRVASVGAALSGRGLGFDLSAGHLVGNDLFQHEARSLDLRSNSERRSPSPRLFYNRSESHRAFPLHTRPRRFSVVSVLLIYVSVPITQSFGCVFSITSIYLSII